MDRVSFIDTDTITGTETGTTCYFVKNILTTVLTTFDMDMEITSDDAGKKGYELVATVATIHGHFFSRCSTPLWDDPNELVQQSFPALKKEYVDKKKWHPTGAYIKTSPSPDKHEWSKLHIYMKRKVAVSDTSVAVSNQRQTSVSRVRSINQTRSD
jgi:hypothetical protein